MAPWLALITDGMLLAALVVIWVRRHRRKPVRAGPWAAFWARHGGNDRRERCRGAVESGGNRRRALWPPACLAITLELIALVASPASHHPITTDAPAADRAVPGPGHAQSVPEHGPTVPDRDDRARETGEASEPGHDPGTDRGHVLGDRPAADSRRARCCARGRSSGYERACARGGARSRERGRVGARNPSTRLARTGTTGRSGPGVCLTATSSPGFASRRARPGRCPVEGK
jgi:hypothetical protein